MTYYYYSLVLDRGETRVLILREGSGWSLPCNRADSYHFWQNVHHEHALLEAEFGIDVFTLRLVWAEYEKESESVIYLYARTCRQADAEVRDGTWIDVDQMDSSEAQPAHLRPAIAAWREWHENGTTERPLPWSSPEWYDQAIDWIDEELRHRGLKRTAPPVQFNSRPRGTVFEVPTGSGKVYFKSVCGGFAHEPSVSERLGSWVPDRVAHVMAQDSHRGWFLCRGIDGEVLAENADRSSWMEAMSSYGKLQRDLACRSVALQEAGCPEINLADYSDQISDIVHAERWGVVRSDFDQVLDGINRVKDLSRTLSQSAIPITLEHGDLSPWQTIVTEEGSRFIDWSDACLTHPFLSIYLLLESIGQLEADGHGSVKELAASPGFTDELIEAYLSSWSDYGTVSDLMVEIEAAKSLGPVHVALKFARILGFGFDPKWDLEGGVPMYLKAFVDRELR